MHQCQAATTNPADAGNWPGQTRRHRRHQAAGTGPAGTTASSALSPWCQDSGGRRSSQGSGSTLAGLISRAELVVAGYGDNDGPVPIGTDTGSLRAHRLAIGPGPGSCRRPGGMEGW